MFSLLQILYFSLQKYNQFADYLIPHKQNVNPRGQNMTSGWNRSFEKRV